MSAIEKGIEAAARMLPSWHRFSAHVAGSRADRMGCPAYACTQRDIDTCAFRCRLRELMEDDDG